MYSNPMHDLFVILVAFLTPALLCPHFLTRLYFTDLSRFTKAQLEAQVRQLGVRQ